MRLERLEVRGFGRLHDRCFDFGERITVVLGPNESGKSTLHRALRAALYGIDAGGPGRPRERSDWARWAPWTGERYGVVLTYRLDSGIRMRSAQSFDRGRMEAQVQELGGGDVTGRYRSGRSVSPALVDLGIDEAVFCAAGWLGEEGLRLSAPDAPGLQAGRLREALERMVDSGLQGTTAAQALGRLEDALRRVGSERRAGTPLGVATAQARRLEAELDAARRRMGAYAEEEERLRRLEAEVVEAVEAATAAERSWLAARVAAVDREIGEAGAAAGEVAALTAALEAIPVPPALSLEDEAHLIALGGELHQAELSARDAEEVWGQAAGRLEAVRRRRGEIAAGLAALPAIRVPPDVTERAADLRRRLGVSEALAGRGDELDDAGVHDQALRREIAATGLGAVDPARLDELAALLGADRAGRRLRSALRGAAGALAVLGAAATALVWIAGQRAASVALAAALLAGALGLEVAGWLSARRGAAARRSLAASLPGMAAGPGAWDRLAPSLTAVRRLHMERERRAAVLEARRSESARAAAELEGLVDACRALAEELNLDLPPRPPRGSTAAGLRACAGAALAAVEMAARQCARRQELAEEEARLATEEGRLAEAGAEAARRREAVLILEARIRRITAAAGVDSALPPLAAVAAFREACAQRRQHDELATRLAEARRRRGGDTDLRLLAERRAELVAELERRGSDSTALEGVSAPDAAQLAELERVATATRERAVAARVGRDTVRARLEGLTGSLPSLADLEDDRLAVSAARDRALHQRAALQRAMELIEAAGGELHRQVAPRLAASVSARLGALTGGRYTEANVDMEHFAVSLACAGRDQLVPLELVSHGTRDQVSLLLRLALCEILGDCGESVPLLLDEPLATSDPERRSRLIAFLSELSRTNQVVLTACDRSLATGLAAHEGALTIELPAEDPALASAGPRSTGAV
jgi:energy-coupling factor transporter ATP-binding protein EcfA2